MLLSTGQFKNGSPILGNGTTEVWNVETGTQDGTPSTQGPIIAANLIQGDAIPPPNTYAINKHDDRTYLGTSRSVNILNVAIFTPDYSTTLTYIYDKASGMLLEATSKTIQTASASVTSEYSYSIIETNIFNPTPLLNQFIIIFIVFVLVVVVAIIAVIVFLKRRI